MERKTARIGGAVLGKGMPKICVPVMGKAISQIADAAARAKEAHADIIELRMDAMSAAPDMAQARAACSAVRGQAPDIPLLFTLRTERDGGAGSADTEAYEALLSGVIAERICDAVDCELSAGGAIFEKMARRAKEAGVTLVGSSHEFGEIGNMQRAYEWLMEQEKLGADVCKAAVMTKTPVQAMEAMLMFARASQALSVPMIGIAMGPAGVLTRIGGACMGSCLTFGTAGEASAPGQIDAGALRQALMIVQDAIDAK